MRLKPIDDDDDDDDHQQSLPETREKLYEHTPYTSNFQISPGSAFMCYVAKNLVDGEEILDETTVSLWNYSLHIIVCAAMVAAAWLLYRHGATPQVSILLAALGISGLAFAKVLQNANELAVTDQRVIIKVGLLFQKSTMIYLTRVEGVDIDQPLSGRILGYGTIHVRGVGSDPFPVKFVRNPNEFRRAVFKAAGGQSRHDDGQGK